MNIATAPLVSKVTGQTKFPTGDPGERAATAKQIAEHISGVLATDNGLTGNGTVNDANALNTLIGSLSDGDVVVFPLGTYRLANVVNVNKQLTFLSMGAIIDVDYDGTGFNVTEDNVTIKGFKFIGSGGSLLGSQIGIKIDGGSRFNIDDCKFNQLAQAGLYFEDTQVSDSAIGGTITNCKFWDNNYCIQGGSLGEYVLITACTMEASNFGMSYNGGNVVINGCNITYNNLGLEHLSGSNNAHGMIVDSNINHNTTYNLKIHDAASGMTIKGCHFYEGDVWLKNTFSVNFSGGIMDNANYYFENSKNTVFNNVTFDTSYVTSVQNNFNSTTSTTNYFRCHKLDGSIATDPITFLTGKQSDDVVVKSTDAFYLGDPNVDGSWRVTRSGNNLVRQRRESGSWVTKGTDTP